MNNKEVNEGDNQLQDFIKISCEETFQHSNGFRRSWTDDESDDLTDYVALEDQSW
jgi:hypothetical protein